MFKDFEASFRCVSELLNIIKICTFLIDVTDFRDTTYFDFIVTYLLFALFAYIWQITLMHANYFQEIIQFNQFCFIMTS